MIRSDSYSVDERDRLSPEQFMRDYVAMRRPVLLRGALKHCGELSNWTLSGLRERAGSNFVTLKAWSASGLCVTKSRLELLYRCARRI